MRFFKLGTNAVILTIAIVGIIVVLYAIADRHHKRIDFTKNKQFSLSTQTKKVLKNLNADVKITAFFKDGTYLERMAEDLLNEYKYASKKVSITFVDPDKKPALASQYGIKAYNTTVFQTNNQRKDIQENDILTYNPYEQTPPEFKGEEAYTNAIIELTKADEKTICFLEGHGERDIDNSAKEGLSEIKDVLEKENYVAKKINLILTKDTTVPKNCNVLVIVNPVKPLFEQEISKIKEYLKNNAGKVVLLLEPPLISPTIGIDKLTSPFGIEIEADIIIDPSSSFLFDALTPMPSYGSHIITKELNEQKIGSILPTARSVRTSVASPADIETTTLLETTPDGWAETDFQSLKTGKVKYDEGKDIKGPVSIGIVVTKKVKNDEMKFIIIGDSDFISNNEFLERSGNRDLFVNTVNWLAGEENKISIRPKNPEMNTINLSGPQAKLIFYSTVFATPLMIFIIGGTIWLKRRNL